MQYQALLFAILRMDLYCTAVWRKLDFYSCVAALGRIFVIENVAVSVWLLQDSGEDADVLS